MLKERDENVVFNERKLHNANFIVMLHSLRERFVNLRSPKNFEPVIYQLSIVQEHDLQYPIKQCQ